jgi:2-iminobutanoate/2-iminopropanoate deaminase
LKTVQTSKAPKPIGPYSQGIVEGGFVFTSGMVAIDPETSKVVSGGIREQTKRVLENVKAILEEAGSSMQKVTKTTVYLKEQAYFKDMNEVYASYFGDHKPTRSTIVCDFMLSDVLVEIDVIAKA